ncbi:hypothetical protein AGLY_016070 [Aphis glycines]|uniref:Uncharacterized protein n=1 Tax=Aphis glycines TaxID=307491 RepID=A0A6G0SZE1_APHGL|nr:hypothetical protein AGLY_016070 [Aphis glycines]
MYTALFFLCVARANYTYYCNYDCDDDDVYLRHHPLSTAFVVLQSIGCLRCYSFETIEQNARSGALSLMYLLDKLLPNRLLYVNREKQRKHSRSGREERTYEHSVQRPTTKRHKSNQSKQQYMYNKFGYDIDKSQDVKSHQITSVYHAYILTITRNGVAEWINAIVVPMRNVINSNPVTNVYISTFRKRRAAAHDYAIDTIVDYRLSRVINKSDACEYDMAEIQ